MDVKDAVKFAKSYVAELFGDEIITNLGLEEVEFDDKFGTWNITVGFSRPWNTVRNALTTLTGESGVRRVYRLVRINDSDGKVVSVTRRTDQDS